MEDAGRSAGADPLNVNATAAPSYPRWSRHLGGGFAISRLLGFVGMTVGGGLGWWLGARHGIMTAFIVSVVGTGVGLYVGKRVADTLGG